MLARKCLKGSNRNTAAENVNWSNHCGKQYENSSKNLKIGYSPVEFSRSVMSNSLQPHGLQHTRPPCPSPTPRVYSNSCPLSQGCHPTILSSVVPFSSHPQSLPASGSFQMSQLFASSGQSTGVSVSTSVLPMKGSSLQSSNSTSEYMPKRNENRILKSYIPSFLKYLFTLAKIWTHIFSHSLWEWKKL